MVDMKTHEAKVYAASDYEKQWLAGLNDMNSKVIPRLLGGEEDPYREADFRPRAWLFQLRLAGGDATNNLKAAGNDDLRYVALPIVSGRKH